MSKSKKKRLDIVYSTNPDYEYEFDDEQEEETLPLSQQKLFVSLDKKQRKGKKVSLVTGFVGGGEDLNNLAKAIKNRCGVGGTSKNGVILIQGDFRDKIVEILSGLGYCIKKTGG